MKWQKFYLIGPIYGLMENQVENHLEMIFGHIYQLLLCQILFLGDGDFH